MKQCAILSECLQDGILQGMHIKCVPFCYNIAYELKGRGMENTYLSRLYD